ncbi:MAG: lipoyl(octanoyl) transferase LipB [Planctomycetota bacterium]
MTETAGRHTDPDSDAATRLPVVQLGRMPYPDAYQAQLLHHAEVLAGRDAEPPAAELGRLLIVEHDPVLTVSHRKTAPGHIVASRDRLTELGVAVEPTDRGGDVTYHGPGQLVVYPVVDLNRLKLRLHEYMRRLEGAVIDALATFGVEGWRDSDATGVWLGEPPGSKVCALGVRVKRWVSLHGLALNVAPDMSHFDLIVPCGLAGRQVTSLQQHLGPDNCPSFNDAASALVVSLRSQLLGLKAEG